MVDTGLCKNVRIRFENLLKLLKPSDVAAAIVSAQRKGMEELTVPRKFFKLFNNKIDSPFLILSGYLFFLNAILRIFPNKASDLVRDFIDSGVESDM